LSLRRALSKPLTINPESSVALCLISSRLALCLTLSGIEYGVTDTHAALDKRFHDR
jgi:hypothetical protein